MTEHIDLAYLDQIHDEFREDGSHIHVHWSWRSEDGGKHWIFAKEVVLGDPPDDPGASRLLLPRTDVAVIASEQLLDMLFGGWDAGDVVGLLRQLVDTRE